MKIKGPISEAGAFPRVHGVLITHWGKERGLRAQKWPRPRPEATSSCQYYQQWEFGIAAAWASNPEPIMYQSAIELAKGTDLTPRDMLMKAIFGTYYDVTLPDGSPTTHYRDVTQNAQCILDQVTDTVGSLLYRASIGWVGLPAGLNGQLLTSNNGLPGWQSITLGGGGAAAHPSPWFENALYHLTPAFGTNPSLTTIATNANQLYCMPITVPWTRTFTSFTVNITTVNATAGANGVLGLYNLNTTKGAPGTVLHQAGSVALTPLGNKAVATSITLDPGTYFIAWWPSHNCNVAGIGGTTGGPGMGVGFNPTSLTATSTLVKVMTPHGTLPDMTAQTMSAVAGSLGYPLPGMR